MRVVLSVLLPSLALAACAAPTTPYATASQAIIKGVDSPATDDAVVLIIHLDNQAVEACSATLIAKNLLLTARHCVAQTDEGSACNEDGEALAGGGVGKQFTPSDLYVFTGNTRPDFSKGRPDIAAQGAKIFVPDSDTICANDIALILLDQEVENAKIAPLRLDGAVVAGETISSVGWGVTEKTASPDVRQRRDDVEVLNVGPLRQSQGRSLGPSEFEVGESICSGDSGGPAFSTDTGAILGVVSRGGNGKQSQTDPSVGCEGSDAFNIYTGVAGHRDLILQAFAEAGATPWLEGELNPILAPFGTECATDDECQQGKCVQTSGDTPTCNLDCEASECPSGFECTGDAGAMVCTEVKAKDDDDAEKKKGGCAVGGDPSSFALLGFAFAASLVARRARRRSAAPDRHR